MTTTRSSRNLYVLVRTTAFRVIVPINTHPCITSTDLLPIETRFLVNYRTSQNLLHALHTNGASIDRSFDPNALDYCCAFRRQSAILLNRAETLSGTLKTFQRAACNEESMMLQCPMGTKIAITLARYGQIGENAVGKCSTTDPAHADSSPNETCQWTDALQVRLFMNFAR